MKNISKISLLVMMAGAVVACTPNISPDVIQAGNANEVTNTVQGTIVSMRIMTVKGDSDNKAGMLAGGLAGGVAGSAIGGGTRMNALGAIGGAVIGGIAGDAIQDKLSTQQGIEYIIKLTEGGHKGRLLTVVQGAGSQAYTKGQCVYVVEGAHARIASAC